MLTHFLLRIAVGVCILGSKSVLEVHPRKEEYRFQGTIMTLCEQGDREKQIGLSVSPLMDRQHKGGITRSQVRHKLCITCACLQAS